MNLVRIEMQCPYCEIVAKLGIEKINRKVACPVCQGQFNASPYLDASKIDRIRAGCSKTKKVFGIAFEHDGVKHRIASIFHPKLSVATSGASTTKVKALPIRDVDFGKFVCPWCGSSNLDHCSLCDTWICHGAVQPTARGRENCCPNCGPNIFNQPIVEVPIYSKPIMQPRVLPASNAIQTSRRLALPPSLSLIKRTE